jgi:hypothetical protein
LKEKKQKQKQKRILPELMELAAAVQIKEREKHSLPMYD